MLDLIEVGLSLLNEMNREQINRVVLNKYQNLRNLYSTCDPTEGLNLTEGIQEGREG